MDTRLANLTFCCLILLTLGQTYAHFGVGYDGDELYLNANQDQTITLDCSDIRTGTVRLAPELTDCADSNFHVNFRVKYGPRCRGYFRFYINIRKLHLDHNEEIRMFDSMYSRRYARTFLGQHLPEFTSESNAESVSQFFTSRDSLRLEYSRIGSCDRAPTDLVLDFTLVQTDKKRTHDEFYCPTLRGYIPRILFCANDSRITCPDGFRWTDNVRNPAFNRQMIDRCKNHWIPADLPEFIDQWIPHGVPFVIPTPAEHHDHGQPWNPSSWNPSSWNPSSWSPSSWIPKNIPWLRPGQEQSRWSWNNQADQYSNDHIDHPDLDISEFHKRIVGFGGPYDSETDLPDPIVFSDILDKPDKPEKPETTDKPDWTDGTDGTDMTEWTDAPDATEATDTPDGTDAPDVEDADDGPLQAPWRSPPMRLSRLKHHNNDNDNDNDNENDPRSRHHHNQLGDWTAFQIVLIAVAAVLGFIILPAALCCWCMRRGQRVEYHRLQTDGHACALPGGYGTFDPNYPTSRGYGYGSAFNGPTMSAPSYPYPPNEVKIRPPN